MEEGHGQRKRRSKEKVRLELEKWHRSHPAQDLQAGVKTALLSVCFPANFDVHQPGVNVTDQGLRNGENWICCQTIFPGS